MIDRLSQVVAGASPALAAVIGRHRNGCFCVALTLLMFLPAIAGHGTTGAYLFAGDSLAWYLPTLAKTHALLGNGHFVALDFSAYNGSVDFFATPVFPYFDPFVVLYAICTPASWAQGGGLLAAFTALLAAHLLIACYFTLRWLQDFLGLRFASACIGATLFAFGLPVLGQTAQFSFLVCAAFMPWALYATSRHAVKPTTASASQAALAVLCCLLGGYPPLAAFSLGVALSLFVAVLWFGGAGESLAARVRKVLRVGGIVAIAFVVAAPLLFAIHDFHLDSLNAQAKSLEWAAHDLANTPHSLIGLLSPYLVLEGNVRYSVGLPAIVVTAIFLLVPGVAARLQAGQARIAWLCVAAYLVLIMATLGTYTAVSDLIYYLLPQVGSMHSYQRFLVPGQLVLAVALAVMCEALLAAKPQGVARAVAFASVVAMFVVAYFLATSAPSPRPVLGQYLVVEALLSAVLAVALLAPGKYTAGIVAWAVLAAPSLDHAFAFGASRWSLASQREVHPVELDEALQERFIAHLRRLFPGHAELKYLDATPLWIPGTSSQWFPKNFPALVLERVRLTSFGGYPNHILARRDYAKRMPLDSDGGHEQGVQGYGGFTPDPRFLEGAGASFFIANEDELRRGASWPMLADAYARATPGDLLRFPGGTVAVPFDRASQASDPSVFEDAAFRAIVAGESDDVARGRPATQSGADAASAARAVDGITDGDFTHGSVSHTVADRNAWLDIDLGEDKRVDSVRIWNRTDCCGERLGDYWIFVSRAAFSPRDRADDLRNRPGVFAVHGRPATPVSRTPIGAEGRFVRVQLAGSQPIQHSYLALAEVEVFTPATPRKGLFRVDSTQFNFANRAAIAFETTSPVSMMYRYSFNKRLVFTLDGQPVAAADLDGLPVVRVEPGKHTLEVTYRHPGLALFWILYAALVLWAALSCLQKWRAGRAPVT